MALVERSNLRDEVQLAGPEAREERAETASRERYVGGHAPAATEGKGAGAADTASELAYAADDREEELKRKIKALVNGRYGGDYQKAFAAYDADGDGAIDKAGLMRFLADAGVGNGLTRGAWASGVMDKLDANGDGKIQWSELERMTAATA